ncbi:hypothetical protein MMC30_003228 [Trapelia coarctata]|nr:hypothetical protein [Trapelia coarctata]
MSGVVISRYRLAQMDHPGPVMVGTIVALYDVGAHGRGLGPQEDFDCRRRVVDGGEYYHGGGGGADHDDGEGREAGARASRGMTGVGIGYITSICAVYQAEVSITAQRGWQVCCQLTILLVGLMFAYFVNYGMFFHPGDIQWRFPLLFQIVFSLYIMILMPFLPETPRWLIRHEGTLDRGHIVLAKLRGKPMDDPAVRKEVKDIVDVIAIESREEGSWMDLFRDGGISANKRFFLALGCQFMQQTSGINIISYYAPTIFQDSLGMSQETSLFLGCFAQWYMIDRVGRRKLFISMGMGMCLVLVCEAICVAICGHSASIAAIFFVFLFEGCFSWGWMATVWVYPSGILPLKIRAKGAALAAAADFLGNFIVVEITPPALANIGWKTYINFVTGGQQLEAIDKLFVERERDVEDSEGWYRKLQWKYVGKADRAVKLRTRTEG